MKNNNYEIRARIFPAIITLLPMLLFSHFYLYKKIPDLLNSIVFSKVFSDVSILFVLLYVVIHTARFLSKKFLQDNLFQDELYFPTTTYLLYSDSKYTTDHKNKIRAKIEKDFNVKLPSQEYELKDENYVRKSIKEAIALIRNKVKNGHLLLQHNIEYGFVRNLVGGSLMAIPFSIFNIIFFSLNFNKIALVLSVILLLAYLVIFFCQKKVLTYFAYNYADILFNEYLTN